MNTLNFAENLIRLRRNKKITQEELADFIGVTKASVSKWETRQSLPDILILPQLAAYFNVTVDELLGYAPQLGKEQIQKIYHELSEEFAHGSFKETMEKSRALVKQYYSCFPFLFQIAVLWLNHYMIAETQEEAQRILKDMEELCGHILLDCTDRTLCNDTIALQAVVYLQMGKNREVIELLEEVNSPYRLRGQSESILIQAYHMAGEKEKAISYTQMTMYVHLMLFVSSAVWYMELMKDQFSVCEQTIHRVDSLCELYGIKRLNGHSAAIFQMQAAVFYAMHQKESQALDRLRKYVDVINWMMEGEHLLIHEDDYFDRISQWYEGSYLGDQAPRSKKVIMESAVQIFSHPAFSWMKDNVEFIRIRQGFHCKNIEN